MYLKGYGWIRVFRFEASNGRTDYVSTNHTIYPEEEVKEYLERRWKVEVLHR